VATRFTDGGAGGRTGLRSLPDEDYATVADVWRAMGGATEPAHT